VKFSAAILFLYLLGLIVQPLAWPLHPKAEKVPACCAAKHKGGHRGCTNDKGCCADGNCNPFFTQCPVCAATAVQTTIPAIPARCLVPEGSQKFIIRNDHFFSSYTADILRPPQSVC